MGKCYALQWMRPPSISCAESYVEFLAEKSIMKNLANETVDARCVDYVYIYICMIDSRILSEYLSEYVLLCQSA
jgi:hypothetical protein